MKRCWDAIDAAAWSAVAGVTVWFLRPVVKLAANHIPALDELGRMSRAGEGAGHPRVTVDRARPTSRRHDKAAPSRARRAA